MKRFIGMSVVLALLCGILPAYAAGGLTATEETWYVTSHSDDWRVRYYATIQNDSDEPETVNDALFEIQNAAGTTVESTTKYRMYPEILQPGEQGWLVITQDVKDVEDRSAIDHYTLTLTSKKEDDEADVKLQAAGGFLKKDEDENENVLRAAITNDGDRDAFQITVAMAARDAGGRLLYVANAATKDFGLAAGGSMLVRDTIDGDIADALEDEGTEVASVDAVAYTVVDLDD